MLSHRVDGAVQSAKTLSTPEDKDGQLLTHVLPLAHKRRGSQKGYYQLLTNIAGSASCIKTISTWSQATRGLNMVRLQCPH